MRVYESVVTRVYIQGLVPMFMTPPPLPKTFLLEAMQKVLKNSKLSDVTIVTKQEQGEYRDAPTCTGMRDDSDLLSTSHPSRDYVKRASLSGDVVCLRSCETLLTNSPH